MSYALARRYARALADIIFAEKVPAAQLSGELQRVKQNLSDFAATLRESPALYNVLSNPSVSREQKLKLLDRLRDLLGLARITRNFLAVLLEHRRLDQLDPVVAAFDEEVYARLGIVPVEVTTAVPLSATQKNSLEERLAALAGARVETRFHEDAAILAGGVARLGSTIYDGSLRAQLRRLQQQLTTESR
ncbi:MAG TPA: ATP synthase F1 subunit delta [Candidatus Xenobia bacterium]|nr:ATP synthase F1 subunit delta [Candidatus Xenobia bacterium]